MYYVQNVQVKPEDTLYPYCDKLTKAANNLYNATLFRIRQVMTGVKKDPSELTENEKNVFEEIQCMLESLQNEGKGNKHKMPTKEHPSLSFMFLLDLLSRTKNPDYYCEDISRQSAQQTVREVTGKISEYYSSFQKWRQDNSSFTGKPNLPHYRKKGGNHTVILTNQECKIHRRKDGTCWAKIPLTELRCELGKVDPSLTLKEATVTPFHDIFILGFVLEDGKETPSVPDQSERICSIDIGVNNLAAITNNAGLPCLLFKGGVAKSVNQWYNKRMAEIKSEQTKGSTEKFVPTEESKYVCVRRENQLADLMHKTAKAIVSWCSENVIQTIVIGHSKGWKQNADMGSKNNQNFVQIPFMTLIKYIQYLAERKGIRVVIQEESYTSKASFLDRDPMPVYSESNTTEYTFSGRRAPTTYHGHKKTMKKNGSGSPGFHGLYKAADGTIINADLNGSANIGRKAFPDMFDKHEPDFNNVIVIRHPDLENMFKNKKKQSDANQGKKEEEHHISKSKARRDKKKLKKKEQKVKAA